MPLINAFRRGRGGISDAFEANIDVQRDVPGPPRSCTCLGMPGRKVRKLSRTEAQSHREIPSATTLKFSRTCCASKRQPEDSPSASWRRFNVPDLGFFLPRQRRTHSTAASLSPRNNTQSPIANGRSSHAETRGNVETTMPSSSRALVDISFSSATDLHDL